MSVILQETVRLNTNTSKIAKTNYHLIVEEYDGETLPNDEEITEGSALIKLNFNLLTQLLIKNRSWNLGKKSYEKEAV